MMPDAHFVRLASPSSLLRNAEFPGCLRTSADVVASLIFFSCKKDSFIPDNEIPNWLKTRISRDEQKIKDSPKYMASWGAWLRYKWKTEYYFEYHNILSSSLPIPISVSGDSFHFYAGDINHDYYKEKCCRVYVWKAPKYIDF